MSSKRGNVHRSRPQKYQNTTAFKNDLHDKSVQTKRINNLKISEVCEKCKRIIEWKIKYKKFKPLKAPKTCVKCSQRNVKHAYHTLCCDCANQNAVCPKCGLNEEVVPKEVTLEEQLQLDREMQNMLKSLTERKRRTFMRYIEKQKGKKKKMKVCKEGAEEVETKYEKPIDTKVNEEVDEEEPRRHLTKDYLLAKLNALKLSCKTAGSDDDEWGSELDDSDLDDDDGCDSDSNND